MADFQRSVVIQSRFEFDSAEARTGAATLRDEMERLESVMKRIELRAGTMAKALGSEGTQALRTYSVGLRELTSLNDAYNRSLDETISRQGSLTGGGFGTVGPRPGVAFPGSPAIPGVGGGGITDPGRPSPALPATRPGIAPRLSVSPRVPVAPRARPTAFSSGVGNAAVAGIAGAAITAYGGGSSRDIAYSALGGFAFSGAQSALGAVRAGIARTPLAIGLGQRLAPVGAGLLAGVTAPAVAAGGTIAAAILAKPTYEAYQARQASIASEALTQSRVQASGFRDFDTFVQRNRIRDARIQIAPQFAEQRALLNASFSNQRSGITSGGISQRIGFSGLFDDFDERERFLGSQLNQAREGRFQAEGTRLRARGNSRLRLSAYGDILNFTQAENSAGIAIQQNRLANIGSKAEALDGLRGVFSSLDARQRNALASGSLTPRQLFGEQGGSRFNQTLERLGVSIEDVDTEKERDELGSKIKEDAEETRKKLTEATLAAQKEMEELNKIMLRLRQEIENKKLEEEQVEVMRELIKAIKESTLGSGGTNTPRRAIF